MRRKLPLVRSCNHFPLPPPFSDSRPAVLSAEDCSVSVLCSTSCGTSQFTQKLQARADFFPSLEIPIPLPSTLRSFFNPSMPKPPPQHPNPAKAVLDDCAFPHFFDADYHRDPIERPRPPGPIFGRRIPIPVDLAFTMRFLPSSPDLTLLGGLQRDRVCKKDGHGLPF